MILGITCLACSAGGKQAPAKDVRDANASLATNGSEAASASGECLVYDSFDPLILQQNSGQEVLRFPTYNAALDEFYAKARPAPLCLTMSGYHNMTDSIFTFDVCSYHVVHHACHMT